MDGVGLARGAVDEWADDVPPRELTGGWPAVRLDEPRETQQFEQVRVERSAPRPPVGYTPPPVPATSTFASVYEPPAYEPPAPPDRWSALTDPSFAAAARSPEQEPWSRLAASEVAPPPSPQPQTRMTLRPEVPPPAELRPEIPPYRRRHEGGAAQEQPDDRGGYRMVVPSEPSAPVAEPSTQGTRVAEILAENGGPPPSGGRRRRRYRDEDETNDVLARVLRQN
jgi:hypothetical protein